MLFLFVFLLSTQVLIKLIINIYSYSDGFDSNKAIALIDNSNEEIIEIPECVDIILLDLKGHIQVEQIITLCLENNQPCVPKGQNKNIFSGNN
jgi:hypothetical protein